MPFSFKPPEVDKTSTQFSATAITERIKESKNQLIVFIPVIIFATAIIVSIGLFVYSKRLESQIVALKTQLGEYDAKLGALPVNDMRVLSKKLKATSKILSDHASVDTAFRILEESVEIPITYTRFQLQYNPSNGSYDLTIAGKGPDYKSVILQQMTFASKPYSDYLTKAVFSGVGANEKGEVGFTVKSPIAIKGKIPEEFTIDKMDINQVVGAPQTGVIKSLPTQP
jgi:hypothetical protein